MPKKNGFTLVELVLSVTLLSIVLIFMMTALVELKDKESENGADAKLLVNQAIIAKTINGEIITNGLDTVSACASLNCFNLTFSNGVTKTLKLMSDNQTIFYGNDNVTDFIRTLPSDRTYSSIHYYIYANLEIIKITVSKVYKNEDYDIELYNYMGNKTTNTGGYAAAGLILHYDGINNAGIGVHNEYSSTWMDISGNGNNGLLKNMSLTATQNSGWIENGLVLDGVDDGISLGNQLNDLFKNSNTIEITASKKGLNKEDTLISNCDEEVCNTYKITNDNKNSVSYNSGAFEGKSDVAVVSNDNISTYTYVYNKEQGKVTTYIDGLESVTFESSEISSTNNPFTNAWIGRNAAGDSLFKGTIYSVRVYSYCLSSSKIYNNANIDRTRFIKQFLYTASNDKVQFTAVSSGHYKFELWGAAGSNEAYGAYTSGILELTAGDKLYLYIGGNDTTGNGGWNGGGSGKSGSIGTGGGGSTDIRTVNDLWDNVSSLNSRIMVAAGGGGNSHGGKGAPGGGISGYDGIPTTEVSYTGPDAYGYGASQVLGGNAGHFDWTGNAPTNGTFGIGGNGCSAYGGGGGSGYYGGGGSGVASSSKGGGGSGSSYISGHTGCVSITADYTPTPLPDCETGTDNNHCSIHFSNKVFTSTIMIDGYGYKWTHVRGEQTLMPSPLGGYFSAHQGNSDSGFVRITYLG